LATLAVAVVGGIAVWRWPAPLTAEEEKLVGLWTFPVGPNPPANAVQQFFELRSDRTLLTWGRTVANGATREPNGGRWRLEGDSLIFEHATRDYWTKLARSLDGGRRPERTLVSRMHYLDADAEAFRVSGGNGGVVTFERVVRAGEGD
jgi:hypothetical protein